MQRCNSHPSPPPGRVDASDSERPGGECACDESQSPPVSRSASPPREPPSPKSGRDDDASHRETLIQFSGQPPSFSRCGCIRVIRPMRTRKKSEGARDAARSSGPVESSGKNPRGPAFSPASRARCLRLSSTRPPVAEVFIHRLKNTQSASGSLGIEFQSLEVKSPGDFASAL